MSVQKNLLLAALAGCLSVSCAATATDWKPAPFRAGQQRLALGTNAFSQKTIEQEGQPDQDADVLALNLSYGYFYQPNIEIGGSFSYSDTDIGSAEETTWITNGYARYWIDTRNSTRPFVQGRVGIGNTDGGFVGGSDDDLVEYAVGIGLADFISQSTSLDLLLEWADQQYDNTDRQTDGLELSVGLSVYF